MYDDIDVRPTYPLTHQLYTCVIHIFIFCYVYVWRRNQEMDTVTISWYHSHIIHAYTFCYAEWYVRRVECYVFMFSMIKFIYFIGEWHFVWFPRSSLTIYLMPFMYIFPGVPMCPVLVLYTIAFTLHIGYTYLSVGGYKLWIFIYYCHFCFYIYIVRYI